MGLSISNNFINFNQKIVENSTDNLEPTPPLENDVRAKIEEPRYFTAAALNLRLNALEQPQFKDQILKLKEAAAQITRSKEVMNKLQKRKLELNKLRQIITPDAGLTIVPCCGLDLHNIAWLFPESDILLIDLPKFGIKWPFSQGLSSHFRGKDMMNELQKQIYFDGSDGIGFVFLNKITTLLEGNVSGIYFFQLSEKGNPEFLNPADVERGKQENNHALITYKDKDNVEKKIWYLSQNLVAKDDKFHNLCLGLKGNVGNVFIKAVYDNVRECSPFKWILDTQAKRYVSDAEEGKPAGEPPSRFPSATSVIKVENHISLNEHDRFCYNETLYVSPFVIDLQEDLNQQKDRFIEEKKQIMNLWNSLDQDYLKLRCAFQQNALKMKLEKLKESKFEEFESSLEMFNFLSIRKIDFQIFLQSESCFYDPISVASTSIERTGIEVNPISLKRGFSRTTPIEIWERLGLGKKYRELFPSDKDFWNSDESAMEIYKKLKNS